MPRFTGQNTKKINPRYFLNETMDPRLAAMMTLKPGAQVILKTGEVAEIVDVIDPGQAYEVAIDGGNEERTITIVSRQHDNPRAYFVINISLGNMLICCLLNSSQNL